MLEAPATPIHYLAIDTVSDRKGFTIAIRAFALAGTLGNRLTLIGYGRHRRRLEKWISALGVGAIVTFRNPNPDGIADLAIFDTAIVPSDRSERHIGLM